VKKFQLNGSHCVGNLSKKYMGKSLCFHYLHGEEEMFFFFLHLPLVYNLFYYTKVNPLMKLPHCETPCCEIL
jgi:hypothetical protein